jgi:hypothetical protein
MAKVSFSAENKVANNNDYPRLKLEHGERALIVCIEPDPEMEFVHTLRAPEIGPDGRVIKEMKQGKKGEYEAPKMEFIGQHLCFGNFDKVSDKGVDPENCPTCRAAVEEDGVDAPLPRYAMHVLRYGLQPGGWTVREPFSITCEAWVFAAGRFNTLVDLALEWEDLRKHDLKLGPCENKNFQKYDIQAAKGAAWLESAERKKYAAEVYTNNKSADLSALIGRKISREQANEDIARVLERASQANGRTTSNVSPEIETASKSIDNDVADLLGDTKKIDPWAGTETTTEKAASENFTETSSVEAPAKSPADLSFEDVLAGL